MGRVQFWWSGHSISASTINTVVLHFLSAFTSWHPGHLFGRVSLGEKAMMRALSCQREGAAVGIWTGMDFYYYSCTQPELCQDSMQLAFSKEKFGLSSLFRIRLRGCKE